MTFMKAANILKSNVKNEKLGATVLAFLEVTDIHSINLFSSTSSAFTWTVESRHFTSLQSIVHQPHCRNAKDSSVTPLSPILLTFLVVQPTIYYVGEQHQYFQMSFIWHYCFQCRWGPSVLRQSTGQKENYNPMNSLILPKCISSQLLVKPKPMRNWNCIISNARNHNIETSALNSTMSQLDVDDNKITRTDTASWCTFSPAYKYVPGTLETALFLQFKNPLYVCILYIDLSSILALLFQTPILYIVKWRTWSKI